MGSVEAVPDEVVVEAANGAKIRSFRFQICPHAIRANDASLHLPVEPNDMGVGAAQDRAPETAVERDDARAEERFDPAPFRVRHQRLDPRHQLGLDALALDRRNDDWHPCSPSLARFADAHCFTRRKCLPNAPGAQAEASRIHVVTSRATHRQEESA